jgi:MT-A70
LYEGGSPITLTSQTTALVAPVREHSWKPDAFYTLVETLCLATPRLELFAREARAGWVSHGVEVDRFVAATPQAGGWTWRWTVRPDWYLARGWRVVAMRQGVDYRGSLVTRLHMTRESRDGIIRRTRAHGRGGGQWVRVAMYACGARARGGGAVCPNRVELREDLVDRAILRALTDALERQTLDRAIETALDKLRSNGRPASTGAWPSSASCRSSSRGRIGSRPRSPTARRWRRSSSA